MFRTTQCVVLRASSGNAGRLTYRPASGCPVAGSSDKSDPNPENIVKPFSEIPGPRKLPLIGNIWRYTPYVGQYDMKYTHHNYKKMRDRYGPLVRELVLPGRELIHTFNPHDIKLVYEENDHNPTRYTHHALIKYRKDRPEIFKTIGAFLSNGKEWYSMRKLFSPLLLEEDIDNDYSDVMEEICRDFVTTISYSLNQKREVDVLPYLSKWAVETFGAIAFDFRLGCLTKGGDLADKLVKAAYDTHRCVYITENIPLYKYIRTPAYRKLEKAQDYVGKVVTKYMTGDEMGPNALVRKMLSIRGTDFHDVNVMVQDMFLAGIDTMSNTTAFAFYNLARNQRVQNELRAILMQEMPTKTSSLTPVVEDLFYLDSIVKETLRVNPVAFGNGRVLQQDMTLSGYDVPRLTQVIMQHLLASRNPAYFPHPDVFWPERWHTESPDPLFHPIAYAPFGFGARGCMGKKIAIRQMGLVLAHAVRNFKITYHYKDIDMACRLVNVPDKPVTLRFIPVEK